MASNVNDRMGAAFQSANGYSLGASKPALTYSSRQSPITNRNEKGNRLAWRGVLLLGDQGKSYSVSALNVSERKWVSFQTINRTY